MKIQRYYTTQGEYPLKKIKFKSVVIKNLNKSYTVRAPSSWSDQAIQIFAAKYLKRPYEKDFAEVFHRLALAYQKWAKKLKVFQKKKELDIFYDEILFLLSNQSMAPNSPQWFNTGLYEAYGLKGEDQGHYALNLVTQKVEPSKFSYMRPQAHACFIQSVEDSLVGPNGLMDLLKKEARLFKFGSGSGTNFSSLRSRGEALKHGGASSGVLSFLRVSDRSAAAISSGGTTRRAAKMVILDDDHPEILDFIKWKGLEEIKALGLVEGQQLMKRVEGEWPILKTLPEEEFIKRYLSMGVSLVLIRHLVELKTQGQDFIAPKWSLDYEGEIYQTLSGQNANHSVRVSDKLIKAVERDLWWTLHSALKTQKKNKIKARELWQHLSYYAWLSADPGVIFKDTINQWNPCPLDGEIRATNPCGEYIFLDDTACNLASLNLLKFEKKSGEFDIAGFEHAVDITILILELTVSMASYPSEVIAKRSLTYRTLGLGVTNLGALLMQRGLAYDSDEGRSFAQCLVSLMSGRAWLMSCQLAQDLAPYPAFKRNKKYHLNILKRHAKASKQIQAGRENQNLKGRADETWKQVLFLASKSGVRHAQTTLIAPTGTISLIMDCDTMGVEPEFSLRKKKFLSGGGELVLLNSQIAKTLDGLKYSSEKKQRILNTLKLRGDIKASPDLKEEHHKIFDCARDISVDGHLLMMACLQPFLSGGISKTINLPANFSIESIQALYQQAHKLGLKAVALYREHSKMSEPLVSWQESSLKCHLCGQKNIVLVGRCYLCQDCGETSACA
jgi:ribonucleoside-diphosphate reductase alpha chain